MRRAFYVVLTVLLLAVSLSGCDGQKKRAEEGLKLSGGRRLVAGAALNETPFEGLLERHESNSCIGSGTDVFYKYEGFSVTAYPDGNGGHYAGMIKIDGSGAETFRGLRVGQTRAEAEELYDGAIPASQQALIYAPDADGPVLTIYFDGTDKVERIVIVYEKDVN